MSRVLLIDDEQLARDRLRRMLEANQDYKVVAEAANGIEAIEQAVKFNPDILLMDIRMPGMDGLEAAQHIARMDTPPAVIFCTAYDEYAIHAFEVQAIGYVLKPVRKQQLFNALERARQLSQSQLSKIVEPTTVKTHLSVKTNTGLEVIALADISHFMADQKYVTAFAGMRELILGQSLKQLEDEFGHGFIRIHRNCLVAIRAIDGLARNKAGQSHIKLKNNGQLLVISRRHLAAVKKFISSL